MSQRMGRQEIDETAWRTKMREMTRIVANGCFDLLHDGHVKFLMMAQNLGYLIVAINSDESARRLKAAKWGAAYPRDSQEVRADNLCKLGVDQVIIFNTEEDLRNIIEFAAPCIIVKGPDYAGSEKFVTGYDIAPVIILDTPETAEVREFKRRSYE